MNVLPYDVVNIIKDFCGDIETNNGIFREVLFELIGAKKWSEFRKYFIEKYKVYCEQEKCDWERIIFPRKNVYYGMFCVRFLLWDDNPGFFEGKEIKPMWRPAMVNQAVLFGGYHEDGSPAHSVVHVSDYKKSEGYDLYNVWDYYWKIIEEIN